MPQCSYNLHNHSPKKTTRTSKKSNQERREEKCTFPGPSSARRSVSPSNKEKSKNSRKIKTVKSMSSSNVVHHPPSLKSTKKQKVKVKKVVRSSSQTSERRSRSASQIRATSTAAVGTTTTPRVSRASYSRQQQRGRNTASSSKPAINSADQPGPSQIRSAYEDGSFINLQAENPSNIHSHFSRLSVEPSNDKYTQKLKNGQIPKTKSADCKPFRNEPFFSENGTYHCGYAEKFRNLQTDTSSNFKPQRNRLQKEGGKSIELYEKWRLMQYKMNIVMKRFLMNHGVNASVLPPCDSYDMWRNVEWRNLYKEVTKRSLDDDPCPDCDVRFFINKDDPNRYTYRVAPSSILHGGYNVKKSNERWRNRKYLNTVLVIGTPQHITIAFCRELENSVHVEYYDPAGPQCEPKTIKAVERWCKTFLKNHFALSRFPEASSSRTEFANFQPSTQSIPIEKEVIFNFVTKNICFQENNEDVMCQTWIWYWIYWRVVRQSTNREIFKACRELNEQNKALTHIQKFNDWLMDLYKLGYFMKENKSEKIGQLKYSPPSIDKLYDMKKKRIQKLIKELETDFNETARMQNLECSESKEHLYNFDDEDLDELDSNMCIKFAGKSSTSKKGEENIAGLPDPSSFCQGHVELESKISAEILQTADYFGHSSSDFYER